MQRVTKLPNRWKQYDECDSSQAMTGKCRTQIPSCDPYDSSPEFKQKRATKLRLNKARVNKAQSLNINNDFPIVSTSSQHRENVVAEKEETESRSFGTVVELGEVFEIEKRVCAGCSKPVAVTTYSSHLHHCLKRFRSESSIDQCPECKISLKRMSKAKKKEHVDRCQRLASESDSSSNSQSKETLLKILDCPFCGRYGENPQWRIGHMKKCAQSKHYTLRQYDHAITIQEKQAQEKLAAGLHTGPAKPVVAPRTRLTRAITEPITYHQEDLQMAKAMSLSLEREERLQREQDYFVAQALSAETQSLDETLIRVLENQLPRDKLSRKKNKKKACTPLLLLRSAEDRAKIIAERAAEVLSKASEFDLTTSALYVNWKDITVHRDWVSNLVDCRLWRLSSLANELTKDPKCFYTPAFLEYEDPKTLGSYAWKHRRLSEIPGYKLPSRSSHEQSLPDSSSTLATQDVVAQLYIQNNENLTLNASGDPRTSETIMEEDEAMGDGFFTQINQQDLVNHSTLSNNLLEMVGSSKLSDVTIQVECELTIPCHRFMLLARCPAAYNELCKDEVGDQYILDWRAISYRGAMTFLKFIYADIKPDVNYADDITKLARRYQIKELIVDGNEFESDEQRFSSNEHAVSDSSREKMDGHNSSGSVKSLTLPTVDPPLHQPIDISVLNIRNTEIDTYIDSPGSGSVSPVLFSSTPFESQTKIKRNTTINSSPKTLPDLKQEEMKVKEQIDIEYDTKSNLVNSKTQLSLRPSLDESSAALSSPILSRSSYSSETFTANMEAFLTPTQKTLLTSTPEIEGIKKRKSLDDDSECLLSLKKRIKMKSQALVKEVTTPTFDLDVENEEPNFTMVSPYAAAEFSPQLEFPSFNVEPSPVFNRVNKSDERSCHTDHIVLISPAIKDPVKHSSSYESTPTSSCKRTQPEKKLKKRKEKVILKKPVATPMPHYSLMETPEITVIT